MKKFFIVSLFLAIVAAAGVVYNTVNAANVNKNIVNGSIRVGEFDKIDVEFFTVEVNIGAFDDQVHYEAPKNIAEKLEIRVKNKKLKIGLKESLNGNIRGNKTKIRVTVPSLEEITTQVGANVSVNGNNVCPSFKGETETGASIKLQGLEAANSVELSSETGASIKVQNVKTSHLEIECETGSSIKVSSGKAITCKYEAETAGCIKAENVAVAQGEAEAETGASIHCNVANLRSSTETGGSVSNEAE